MKKSEIEVLKIIYSWKNNVKYFLNDNELINDILDILNKQKILETVYKTLEFSEDWLKENSKKYAFLKEKTILKSISNSINIKELSELLNDFNDNNVKVILLKGTFLREVYRNPDLRSMSDFDILIKEEDIEKSIEILESNGYKRNMNSGNNGIHILFEKYGNVPIELHWKLINHNFFRGEADFESEVWDKSIPYKINDTRCYILSLEHNVLHLFAHKAVHMVYGGIGIRQLLDLLLFLERYNNEINWNLIIKKLRQSGMYDFAMVTLSILNKYFNYEEPFEIDNIYFNKKVSNQYLNEIFKKGDVKSKFKNSFESQITFDKKYTAREKFFAFIFPLSNQMSEKYNYAKKNKVLIPIAWVHRFLRGIFIKEISLKSKIEFLLNGSRHFSKKETFLKKLKLKSNNS